jgi:hypothetical protein
MEDIKHHQYVENPYAVQGRREDIMSTVRSSFIVSLALFLSVAMVLVYFYGRDRYEIVAQGRGIYVFDRKTSSFSFCDEKGCQLISVSGDQAIRSAFSFAPFGQQESPQSLGFMAPPQPMQLNPMMQAQQAMANPSMLQQQMVQQQQVAQQQQLASQQAQAAAVPAAAQQNQAAALQQQQVQAAAFQRAQFIAAQRAQQGKLQQAAAQQPVGGEDEEAGPDVPQEAAAEE